MANLKTHQNRNFCAVFVSVCVLSLLIVYSFDYTRDGAITERNFKELSVFNETIKTSSEKIDEIASQLIMPSEYCPPTPPNLKGEFDVDFKDEPLDVVDLRLSFALKPGGWFTPSECKPRDRVAIVVSMRDRLQQLPTFLKNIHPMLMRQQIEYAIYVVEQTNDQPFFNKGALFNIGFVESLKMYNWDCFIFHDIDMIPFDDRHIYKCPRTGPMHMGVALDKFNYKILYDEIYGGVSAFMTEDYKLINGFSNLFWGWGGEDNDLRNRVINAHLPILRSPIEIAKYRSLPHQFSKLNPNWEKQIIDGKHYYNTSGLNSLSYHLKEIKIRPSFVHIIIDNIQKETPNQENASNTTDIAEEDDDFEATENSNKE